EPAVPCTRHQPNRTQRRICNTSFFITRHNQGCESVLVALLQINPEIVGVSVWRFRRDGLIQAQREILREVEIQFVYTRDLGMRTEMNTMQRVRANAYYGGFAPSPKSGSVKDEIEATLCR